MGRKIAVPWHLVFFLVAGALYFYFVLPRWHELMGDTPHALGTALRIVTGALIGLAALPVVFTLLRTRKPELGTPQLALSLLTWSIVAHVLAAVLIIGTAISEIWVSLDAAGQYLFGIYGAAAAIAVLGFFAFYLSFVAELPPPPPKPIKPKKPKQRRIRRGKKGAEADEAEDAEDVEAETVEAEAGQPEETETLETAEETVEAVTESPVGPPSPEPETAEEPRSGLQNRRPTGKASHRLRRRTTRGTVTLDE
jgi:MFS family permease